MLFDDVSNCVNCTCVGKTRNSFSSVRGKFAHILTCSDFNLNKQPIKNYVVIVVDSIL